MSVWEGLSPPYSTIVADPPWPYQTAAADGTVRRIGGGGTGDNPPVLSSGVRTEGGRIPYGTMTLDQIRDLPVADLGDDSRCFLWVTNRYLHDGPGILRAWGFEPQTRTLVWCKPPMGTLNVTTEFVLIGRRGRPPRLPWHPTTWFQWARPHHAHSQKPDAFLDLVESWCPGPYVELFGRRTRLGWDSWGHGYEMAERTGEAS